MTDGSDIVRLKKDIATAPYLKEWQHINVSNVTSIDENRLKQALFANWILNPDEFTNLRSRYKTLANQRITSTMDVKPKKGKIPHVISNHNLTLINELFGLTPINVQVNATRHASVLLPKSLQMALFKEWPEKENVVLLLGEFAKSMGISTTVSTENGTPLILQPPDPPAKGQQNSDYRYLKYGMQLFKLFLVDLVERTKKTDIKSSFIPFGSYVHP